MIMASAPSTPKAGWEVKTLGEVCRIKPPKAEAKQKLRQEEMVSFVPMNDLKEVQKHFSVEQEKQLGKAYGGYTYFAENDVLLAKITPCFENGKLGIARGLTNGIGFGSSEFVVFRSSDNITPEYLFYFLSRDTFRTEGKEVMTGAVGHKRVPKEFIENYRVPIPPLPEQERIVGILDEAFEGIAAATAQAGKNLHNARELFQSVLQSTFSQKGDDWEETTLGEVCENLDSKRIPITKNKRVAGEVPYYGASGIVDHVAEYIFDEALLLVSEDGANLLARTYPIAFSISGKTWVNNHAHVLKFENLAAQHFMEFYLNSIKLDPYVSGMAQPKLNQKSLNSIPVPSPPLPTQQAIVEKLDALSEETKALEAIYERKQSALAELKQSLLQKAFAGEL